MKKLVASLGIVTMLLLIIPGILAASTNYYVQPGDTLWKISVKHKIGLSEII
ncbi:LysM domain-containing protein [Gracilibacillus ureilyticus]|uniref:LysM domain-containing protein n=1 Tax=Gracilibacillus ureilyticus TaxID=531814 RepID=A0A1H9LXW2_9BACI|nr:LysM domain-containing protein [Gracilibacillus ureilyticus]